MIRRFVLGGLALALVVGVGLLSFRDPARSIPGREANEAMRRRELDKTLGANPNLARPMASYRVHEEKKAGGLVHRGGGYVAETTGLGLHFEAGGHFIELRAARLEQGGQTVPCGEGTVSNPAFGDVRIDRGGLVEQYIFENTRAEQIFRIPHALGSGALTVTVAVLTDLTGAVVQARRAEGGWKDTLLQDGGLAFCDARGRKLIAYHGAIAIDAQGRRADLDPVYANGEITLEVPAPFMAQAAYPVVVDPWLELDFSSSGGGISNSAGVSQTPAVVVVGGGNPWIAWSERVTSGASANFEIFFRYWNGFRWSNLAGSDQGGGISNNTGDSIHPALTEGDIGPYVAWQDDTSGTSCIYLKHWNGSAWEEIQSTTPFNGNPTTSSATGSGVSLGIGSFSAYPSLGEMLVTVPSTGVVKLVPVLTYQSTNPGPTSIITIAHFPGDPGQQLQTDALGNIILNNFPVIPKGWYALGGNGSASQYAVIQMSNTPPGFVSQRPSMGVLPFTNDPIVAWQDTRNGTHDIMVAAYTAVGFGNDNLPLFPTSRPPNFAFGVWGSLAGSFAAGGITGNPPGAQPFSLTPSLALDAVGNPTVAWEQVASLTSSDIYLRQFNGAWVELAGSGSANGISNTPGSISATPSVTINGTTPYVAWQDDESGNSEVYVRRFTGGVWAEAGFQSNSATVGPSAGIGGISQSTGASLAPSIGSDGDTTVAWQDFAGGNFEIFLKRFFENQPQALRQTEPGGVTVVPLGGSTSSATVELRATAFSENTARLVRLQVEVVPVGSPFVGRVTQESGEVTINAVTHLGTVEMMVPFTGLTNTAYQWRARTVDDLGQSSAWISAGGSDGVADVTVSAVSTIPPGAPLTLTVGLVGGVVTLTWSAPPGGADSYNVKRSTVAGGGGYPPATVISAPGSVTGLTFTDTSAVGGTTYFYVVSAVRSGLESLTNSNEVTITVPASAGGIGGGDDVGKDRCALLGVEWLLLLVALAHRRRRRLP